jgi:hypothetical protein
MPALYRIEEKLYRINTELYHITNFDKILPCKTHSLAHVPARIYQKKPALSAFLKAGLS